MIKIAHRGASSYALENSATAISTALKLGSKFIEVDVRHIDGEVFLLHDQSLERIAGISVNIYDKTANYLQNIKIQGEPILTVANLLQLVASQASINFDIKDNTSYVKLMHDIYASLSNGWQIEQFLLSSADIENLIKIRQLDSTLQLSIIIDNSNISCLSAEAIHCIKPYSINLDIELINLTEYIKLIREQYTAVKIFIYTIKSISEHKQMKKLGVDGIFLNDPLLRYNSALLNKFVNIVRYAENRW